jgi:hypothetical protein
LLDAFKTPQQPLEHLFPGKGPFDTPPQRMDGGMEEAFASALGRLAGARILFDVGEQARMDNALPIVCGIKAAIEVERGTSEVQPGCLATCCKAFSPCGPRIMSVSLTGATGKGANT